MRVSAISFARAPASGEPAGPRLAGTLYLPGACSGDAALAGACPGLVVAHGAGSRRTNHDDFCRAACARGFAVLAVDLRGHGDSEGVADGPLDHDVLAAAAYLAAHPAVDARRLCYRGSSMGGFYGLKAQAAATAGTARTSGAASTCEAAERTTPPPRFAALVLLCPAGEDVILDALRDRDESGADAAGEDKDAGGIYVDGSTRWAPAGLRRYFGEQDSLALASRVSCPVMLVHARGDQTVPFEHSLALAGALAGPTTLLALPGGSHTSAQHDTAIHQATLDWLLAQLT